MVSFWALSLTLLGIADLGLARQGDEQVDLIELNHFYSHDQHSYDQVIFYEWSPDVCEYHVRAWILVECKEKPNRRPTRSYLDNQYHVKWFDRDQKLMRDIRSTLFRETWTQIDPESENKKLLDEKLRTALLKQIPAPESTGMLNR